MAYEKPIEPTPQEKLAFLHQAGYRIGRSRVEIGYNWLGGYDTEVTIYKGISTNGEFLGSSESAEVPTRYPVSELVSYKLLD